MSEKKKTEILFSEEFGEFLIQEIESEFEAFSAAAALEESRAAC